MPHLPEYTTERENGKVNDRQLEALAHVQTHGRITNREYRALCPFWHSETLRLDLADLCRRGVLLKVGSKRGTHYVPKGRE